MRSYVVDASVVAAWLLPPADEPLAVQAALVESAFGHNQIELAAPDLIYAEVGNVLRKAVLRQRISARHAKDAVDAFLGHDIPTYTMRPLFALAQAISEDFGPSVYDATYVALAATRNAPLITGDAKLVQRIRGAYPVLWLGDFSLAQ